MVAASEPIAHKLRAIDGAQWPVQFSHVAQPAQAFLVATIAHEIDKTIWVLCPNVHSQELVYESLLNWHPNALFLPEAEFAAVENVLPDPEIAAERLAVVLDGFIVTAAALVAARLEPTAVAYMVAGHLSPEPGHRLGLGELGLRPLLDLELRLGEGTGAALALPLLRASLALLAEMATFDQAGVTDAGR